MCAIVAATLITNPFDIYAALTQLDIFSYCKPRLASAGNNMEVHLSSDSALPQVG